MRFLVDAQLPPALVRFLQERGYDAAHVADVGLRDAEDGAIRQYAIRSKTVVLTKDEDFAAHAVWQRQPPIVVWVRVGNCSNRALLAWFEPLLPEVVRRLDAGERLIEIV